MKFNRNSVLLFQKSQIVKILKEQEKISEDDLEIQYRYYQDLIFKNIEDNYLTGKQEFSFTSKTVMDYFFLCFKIDGFDVRMSGVEETPSYIMYNIEVKWVDMERVLLN